MRQLVIKALIDAYWGTVDATYLQVLTPHGHNQPHGIFQVIKDSVIVPWGA